MPASTTASGHPTSAQSDASLKDSGFGGSSTISEDIRSAASTETGHMTVLTDEEDLVVPMDDVKRYTVAIATEITESMGDYFPLDKGSFSLEDDLAASLQTFADELMAVAVRKAERGLGKYIRLHRRQAL